MALAAAVETQGQGDLEDLVVFLVSKEGLVLMDQKVPMVRKALTGIKVI